MYQEYSERWLYVYQKLSGAEFNPTLQQCELLLLLLLLLLSHFSRVRLCVTPQTEAHQAPPSLGFSRQEHWSGLPFPFPMHESEKRKGSRSVMSDSQRPHGLQPTRLLHPWDFPGKSTGVGCHRLLRSALISHLKFLTQTKASDRCIWFLHLIVIISQSNAFSTNNENGDRIL